MSNKVVVSVSMDAELASDLRAEVIPGGSFSALVCEYVTRGRNRPSVGLLESTQFASDDVGASTPDGHKQTGRGDPRRLQEQATVRPQTSPARPESESESPEEDGSDSHRSQLLSMDRVDQGIDLKSWPPKDDLATMDFADAVLACVRTDDPRTPDEIATYTGLNRGGVHAELDDLVDLGAAKREEISAGTWWYWLTEPRGR